jgi:hypothetical protein
LEVKNKEREEFICKEIQVNLFFQCLFFLLNFLLKTTFS